MSGLGPTEGGWAGDPSDQPWWAFFVLLGVCVAIAATFALLFSVAFGLSPFVARVLVLPAALAVLIYGIRRTLRWMYGSGIGQANRKLEGDDAPRRSSVGFNVVVVVCLLALAALIAVAYR